MTSKYEMINFLKKHGNELSLVYNEADDTIYNADGTKKAPLDKFLEIYRKNNGESFEGIFYDSASLYDVMRCTECGTVIFTYNDERYDPHLKCPSCTGYKTYFKFWTKEEIESDEEKQNEIKHLEDMTKWMNERYARQQRRNGKSDQEIAVKKFYGKKIYLRICLGCDDITESYIKGLRLKIDIGNKTDDGIGYTIKHFYTIPLSWSSFKTQLQVRKYLKEKYDK